MIFKNRLMRREKRRKKIDPLDTPVGQSIEVKIIIEYNRFESKKPWQARESRSMFEWKGSTAGEAKAKLISSVIRRERAKALETRETITIDY